MTHSFTDTSVTQSRKDEAAQNSGGIMASIRRMAPRAGDVLASERSARADVFNIRVVPGGAETSASHYTEAIAKVRELARGLGVDGWFTADQTHYWRVARYRSGEERSG
jgi:hypothetical protein